MYVFKWCKYEDHAPDGCWEIFFQTKKSLIFFQTQGKILKGLFAAQFPNLLEILPEILRKILLKILPKILPKILLKILHCRKHDQKWKQ